MIKKTKKLWKKAVVMALSTGIIISTCGLSVLDADAARSISEIQADRADLQSQINDLNADLVDMIASVNELQSEINEKQTEIDDLNDEIEAATAAAEAQYEAMKKRMQYMYENGQESVLEILIESGSFSEFCNRVEYTNQVYEYDKTMQDNYQATIAEINEMKTAVEEEKAELVVQKQSLAAEKASLDSMIKECKAEMKNFDKELAEAKELARKKAELERQQAEAEAAASGTPSAGTNTAGVSGSGQNPAPTTGISGAAVVAYANQFVGYPYTWGGTDPVNGGADCSGFVMYVYKHFGISWGGRITSAGFRSVGREVSYECMQAGDIVCYAGHVGIYMGNGCIVEAQSSKAGITNTRPVTCHKILAIRRVI